jgi:hypothetical protein
MRHRALATAGLFSRLCFWSVAPVSAPAGEVSFFFGFLIPRVSSFLYLLIISIKGKYLFQQPKKKTCQVWLRADPGPEMEIRSRLPAVTDSPLHSPAQQESDKANQIPRQPRLRRTIPLVNVQGLPSCSSRPASTTTSPGLVSCSRRRHQP